MAKSEKQKLKELLNKYPTTQVFSSSGTEIEYMRPSEPEERIRYKEFGEV